MFKISASDRPSVSISRQMQECADEFLATVSKGVVHGVYKVVIVILRCKVNGGIGRFGTVSQYCIQPTDGS